MNAAEENVQAIADAIRAVAKRARSEEDLKIGVEEVLASVRRQLGILPRYERSYPGSISVLGGGSSDAVYGHAVIEYKRPGALSHSRVLQEATAELRKYMTAEAKLEGDEPDKALRRTIGIGLDGRTIFFLRYRGTPRPSAPETPALPGTQFLLFDTGTDQLGFQRLGPYQVDGHNVARLLLYLRALRRRPLTPEALAEEFGPDGAIAGQVVATLYKRLTGALMAPANPHPRVVTFFSEWDRIFGIVYGQDIAKTKKDTLALARLYGLDGSQELKPLLFAVHTYYALLMKLLAAELASMQSGSLVASPLKDLPALADSELCEQLLDIEDGGLFGRLGIRNFIEGDFFGWYLSTWGEDLAVSIRAAVRTLSEYEPATGRILPEATRDLLKGLYHYLVPKELRHDLGEYYTPDWLAELVLNELGYDGHLNRRLLDPACGSGTFLVLAIQRALLYAEEHFVEFGDVADKILRNIVGFDLNPIAVIAARTNYLLALGDLVRYKSPLELPIYLCDSILTPSLQPKQRRLEHQSAIPISSGVGSFWIPEEVVKAQQVGVLAALLEQCVRRGDTINRFLALCRRHLNLQDRLSEEILVALYRKLVNLEREGRNGIWARIVKNAFAPVFMGRFDYVAGNPPWVNWESLASDYREATKELWQHYGLFSLSGHAARLGGGKKDVAMLMLYAAMDSYLREDGKLGFVVTQTLLKTKGAGDGFRRFRLGQGGAPLKVCAAHDLVALQPFEDATNRTAVVVLRKGVPTTYPVAYTLWSKARPGRIGADSSLEEVISCTQRAKLSAQPVSSTQLTSPWLTGERAALSALQKVLGPAQYRAYAGACTWMNGAYWLRLVEQRPDGLFVVENLHDVGKIKVRQVRAVVESQLIFPLLRGRDVGRWRARPSAYILMVQDPVERTGYEETWLMTNYPRTYDYLNEFAGVLRERSGYKKFFDSAKDSFYSIYNVAEHTFVPHKVVWREQASSFTVAVTIGTDKPAIPDHKLMMVPCQSQEEAAYLAAVLNSSISRFVVLSYVISVSTSTHVLENIAVPAYDSSDAIHQALADLSQKAHALAAREESSEPDLRELEGEIDQHAATLWGLTAKESRAIREAIRHER
jgi:hypothetical protein